VTGGIQPSKLKKYVAEAVHGGEGDDGLMQRIQLLVMPEFEGVLPIVDRPPNDDAFARVVSIFKKVNKIRNEDFGLPNERDLLEDIVPCLHFSAVAQELIHSFMQNLELRFSGSNDLEPAVESHLSKNRSTLPALALLFQVLQWADGDSWGTEIGEEATKLALEWMVFLEEHMRKYMGSYLITM
jgi:putative DNA primase/helicase